MRILMIGGTRFVGKHIVTAALAAGHDVSIFHRGKTGADLFPECEHLIGDRNTDVGALSSGSWDATIDTCGYFPRQIHELADTLGGRGGQMTFISSISAYASPSGPGIGEDAALIELDDPTVEEVTGETYGGLKVLCERALTERHGDGSLIVRPTYVIGPDDYTWRFPWWVSRIARGGTVLAPGPAADPAQYIDGRDMAEWIVAMVGRGAAGTFHTAGPSAEFTWGKELETIAATVAPDGTRLEWVDETFLIDQGLDGGALPLWSGGDEGRWVMAVDPAAAIAAGLRMRPLAETVRDTHAWTLTQRQPDAPGLSASREAELIEQFRGRPVDDN
jgi:2'-hydroxyisoflavone reductase